MKTFLSGLIALVGIAGFLAMNSPAYAQDVRYSEPQARQAIPWEAGSPFEQNSASGDACPPPPLSTMWAYLEVTEYPDPNQALWPGLIPDEEVSRYSTFVVEGVPELSLELWRTDESDPDNPQIDVIATGYLEVLASHEDVTSYDGDGIHVVSTTVAGIMHADGDDHEIIVTATVIEYTAGEEHLITHFMPALFPNNVEAAVWEACFLSQASEAPSGKWLPVSKDQSHISRPPASQPLPGTRGYCASVALKKIKAAYYRYRAAKHRCHSVAIAGGLGGLAMCAAGGLAIQIPCSGGVIAGAVYGQRACYTSAYYGLLAELSDIDAWMLTCCQTHPCPGFDHP